MVIEEVVIEETYYEHARTDGAAGGEGPGDSPECGDRTLGHNKELGYRGEQAAVRYLDRAGYEILERNWTCPAGEADIIARDGCILVFIEVKTRASISKGFPAEAVDAKKRARYEMIAAWYLKGYDVFDVPVRFDVISIMVLSEDRAFMKHYVNAFGVGH